MSASSVFIESVPYTKQEEFNDLQSGVLSLLALKELSRLYPDRHRELAKLQSRILLQLESSHLISETILRQRSTNWPEELSLAEDSLSRNNTAEAIKQLNKIPSDSPYSPEADHLLSIAYWEAGDRIEFCKRFQDKKTSAYSHEVYLNINKSLEEISKKKKLENEENIAEAFLSAILFQPDNVDAYTQAERVSPSPVVADRLDTPLRRSLSRSIAWYNPECSIRGEENWLEFHRGVVALMKNEYEKALNHFEVTLKLMPDLAIAYTLRGITFYLRSLHQIDQTHKEDLKRALNEVNQAIQCTENKKDDFIFPSHPPYHLAYYLRAKVYEKLNEPSKAYEDFKTLLDDYEKKHDTCARLTIASRKYAREFINNYKACYASTVSFLKFINDFKDASDKIKSLNDTPKLILRSRKQLLAQLVIADRLLSPENKIFHRDRAQKEIYELIQQQEEQINHLNNIVAEEKKKADAEKKQQADAAEIKRLVDELVEKTVCKAEKDEKIAKKEAFDERKKREAKAKRDARTERKRQREAKSVPVVQPVPQPSVQPEDQQKQLPPEDQQKEMVWPVIPLPPPLRLDSPVFFKQATSSFSEALPAIKIPPALEPYQCKVGGPFFYPELTPQEKRDYLVKLIEQHRAALPEDLRNKVIGLKI